MLSRLLYTSVALACLTSLGCDEWFFKNQSSQHTLKSDTPTSKNQDKLANKTMDDLLFVHIANVAKTQTIHITPHKEYKIAHKAPWKLNVKSPHFSGSAPITQLHEHMVEFSFELETCSTSKTPTLFTIHAFLCEKDNTELCFLKTFHWKDQLECKEAL